MHTHFQVLFCNAETAARRGRLRTRHGTVETPVFMPVGTQATVKAVTPAQLREVGSQVILANTYHLHLRPGSSLIKKLGGLHPFMGWEGPILTDSGGFQAFSLAKLRKIAEAGITFRSHLNGNSFFLGPRQVMNIQQDFGSDIAMVLDECPPYPCSESICRAAVEHTLRWARECLAIAHDEGFLEAGHHLFAIVQGSIDEGLRRECAEALTALGFSGYAVGGVSVGESEREMFKQVDWSLSFLPEHRPRYVMGVGTPPQLLKMIALGVDMFDCVLPTRAARHGVAYTPFGKINLRNERFKEDPRPLVEVLDNYTCRHFTRAYLRHLVMAKEILASTLLTLHNLHFYLDLMRQVREHLERGDFDSWHRRWISRYEKSECP